MRSLLFLSIILMTSYLLWNGVHRLRGAEEKQEQSLQETRIKDGNIVLDEEVFTQSGLTTTTADEENKQITVPANAVVWWDDKAWVYVEKGSYVFVRTPVEITKTLENGAYTVTGIASSDVVVTTGVQLLLSEEMRGNMHMEDD